MSCTQWGSFCANCSVRCVALALILGCVFHASPALASTISFSFSGTSTAAHPISGTADFTLSAGSATIKLTNTTPKTFAADELFTGLDFTLAGLAPTISTKTGIERTVDGGGTLVDTGSAQNLTWSLVSLGGGSYQLNFNLDAMDAIIGPPTGGNYSGANGSIKGNGGHNPFAAEMATFVLSVPGLTTDTSLVHVTAFRFNTALEAAPGTMVVSSPEPSAFCLMLVGLTMAAIRHWR
jgi:hypothetical protein